MRDRDMPSSLLWLAALLALATAIGFLAIVGLYLETQSRTRVRAQAISGGDEARGRAAIKGYACGACHVIPGIAGALGKVGPDLTHVGQRASLAGALSNDPETMVHWLMHPQSMRPATGMPEQNVAEKDARDMAAYLYEQR